MKLIIVLASITLEHLVTWLDEYRSFDWFRRLEDGFVGRFAWSSAWSGPIGVLAMLLVPLFPLWVAFDFLESRSVVLSFIGGVAVVLYAIGPRDLSAQVESLLLALTTNDEGRIGALSAELAGATGGAAPTVGDAVRGILVQANDRLFAVLVWFVILGPLGAAMYRLSAELNRSGATRAAALTRAASEWAAILAWLPARMMALGFALSGSLIHAFQAWRINDTLGIEHNTEVIVQSGLGALQITDPERYCSEGNDNAAELVGAVRSLIGRTLVVWLTVLAIVTLAGWAA
jgi:membrane protein required for beta-lactamase induction